MPVAALSPAACECVEGFVREALGCACPHAIFDNIRLETDPAGFTGFPGARLLEIGGRLLVLLVDGTPAALPPHAINTLLQQGRKLRDAGGFNRFRLVMVVSPGCDPGKLAGFDPGSMDPVDDRVHLHTLPPSQLPALLRVPVEAQ
jgi:hypothetical protein